MALQEYIAAARAARNPTLYVTVTRLCNDRPHPQPLYLEPWGEMIALIPGGEYDLVAAAPESEYARAAYGERAGHWLTIDAKDDCLIVYAPTGANRFAVFHEDQAIWQLA